MLLTIDRLWVQGKFETMVGGPLIQNAECDARASEFHESKMMMEMTKVQTTSGADATGASANWPRLTKPMPRSLCRWNSGHNMSIGRHRCHRCRGVGELESSIEKIETKITIFHLLHCPTTQPLRCIHLLMQSLLRIVGQRFYLSWLGGCRRECCEE